MLETAVAKSSLDRSAARRHQGTFPVPDNVNDREFPLPGVRLESTNVTQGDGTGGLARVIRISTGPGIADYVTHEQEFTYSTYGIHVGQDDRLTFFGEGQYISVHLIDCRDDSPQAGDEITIELAVSPHRVLIIPKGVAHTLDGLGGVVTRDEPVWYADVNPDWEPDNDLVSFPRTSDTVPLVQTNQHLLPVAAHLLVSRRCLPRRHPGFVAGGVGRTGSRTSPPPGHGARVPAERDRPAPPLQLADETPLDEGGLGNAPADVRMASLRGVDAAHLVLTDIDLSTCQFAGTVHPDQLRMEGTCHLAPAPAGWQWHGWLPVRWTPRRTLAEEQHWRAIRGYSGWAHASADAELHLPGAAALAPVYRQLRNSLEDAKNEPGAADFYYGEMEMRRHDKSRPRAERALLAVYWTICGYGLRASRAAVLLALTMAATFCTLVLWGLPKEAPKPEATGSVTGQKISLTTNTPAPRNPTGALTQRFSGKRVEKALQVVLNSVIFRSSGQNLTTVGTYTEMGSRFVEPVLLGLALLAVRGRVKR